MLSNRLTTSAASAEGKSACDMVAAQLQLEVTFHGLRFSAGGASEHALSSLIRY